MNHSLKFANKFLGKDNIKDTQEFGNNYVKRNKIVVYVPENNADEITFAMGGAGAGIIGNYSLCSFRLKGTGTFRGNENSSPVTGQKENFEKADEVRIEMICDSDKLNNIIDNMYSVHPYEEPAFEVYDVKVRTNRTSGDGAAVTLKKSMTLGNLLKRASRKMDIKLLDKKITHKKIKKIFFDLHGNLEEMLKNSEDDPKGKVYISKFDNNKFNIKLY